MIVKKGTLSYKLANLFPADQQETRQLWSEKKRNNFMLLMKGIHCCQWPMRNDFPLQCKLMFCVLLHDGSL